MAPLEPKPPDPHHLAPALIPCCLPSGSQIVTNLFDSRVFVTARLHEDSGMVILALSVSYLKCTNSVSGRSTGQLKGKQFRSVASYGDTVRTTTQISFRSLSLSVSISADAWLVDDSCPSFCEGDKSDCCLLRTFVFDSTPPLDFGWVVSISCSGCFVTLPCFRIIPWLKSQELILGISSWWGYVLVLVHLVDGLSALVPLSMSMYCQNNIPSPLCNNAMNWFYFMTVISGVQVGPSVCCLGFAGCDFCSVLLMHDYHMQQFKFSGLLKHYSVCIFSWNYVCPFFEIGLHWNYVISGWLVVSSVCCFGFAGYAFCSVLLMHDYHMQLLQFSGLLKHYSVCTFSWNYGCHFFEIGLQCVLNFMLGCLVQYNVAPFLVEQLVLCPLPTLPIDPMNVMYFWMWIFQLWLYPICALFWCSLTRICSPLMTMYKLLWCAALMLSLAYFVKTRGHLEILVVECTDSGHSIIGINVIIDLSNYGWFPFLSFHWHGFFWFWFSPWSPPSLMCAIGLYSWIACSRDQYDLHAALISLSLCWWVSLLFWFLLCWLCYLWCEVSMPSVSTSYPYFTLLRCSLLITVLWLWWQVHCDPLFYLQPLPPRLPSFSYLDQHGYMLRTHLCMHSQPLFRGWIICCVMTLFSLLSEFNNGCSVSWAIPSFLLSSLLTCLFAQKHTFLAICFCWHPVWSMNKGDEVQGMEPIVYSQIGRDEVTEMTLLVDEDLLSETSLVIYLEDPRGVCRVAWCFLVQAPGPGTPDSCEGQSRLVGYIRISSTPDISVVCIQFLNIRFLVTYWSFDVIIKVPSQMALKVLLVFILIQCIVSHPETCISGCCTPSIISCNFSVIRMLEQHLCVLGLCLMALELHPWMPRPAHYGCCSFSHCPLLRPHHSYLIVMQVVRCALKRLTIVCIETLFAPLWVKDYFTNCLQ